ncbi:MAG: chemotaxis protein CheW [Glaciimonas sp.]|nr:chemotaxis protein CheW [Glaciimonas sp.]
MNQSNSDLLTQMPAPMQNMSDVGSMSVLSEDNAVGQVSNQLNNQLNNVDARRTRLREFQANFLEKMQVARSGAQTHQNQLGFLMGETRWLLDLQEAGEIVAVNHITSVPLTQDWYLGLINIRGVLVSVVDFARFEGQPATTIDKDSRIVAFGPTLKFNSALLVTRVLGLRNLDQMTLQSSADGGEDSAKSYVDSDGQLWTELKLSQLVQDARFLQVGL